MNITQTIISDNNIENLDASKIMLMDNVIEHFLPLFREEIEKKKKVLSGYTIDYKKLTSEITKTKDNLVKLKKGIKRETLIKEILSEIFFLLSRDILYGKNKKTVLDILDVIKKTSIVDLTTNLKTLKLIIQKNVKRVNE